MNAFSIITGVLEIFLRVTFVTHMTIFFILSASKNVGIPISGQNSKENILEMAIFKVSDANRICFTIFPVFSPSNYVGKYYQISTSNYIGLYLAGWAGRYIDQQSSWGFHIRNSLNLFMNFTSNKRSILTHISPPLKG